MNTSFENLFNFWGFLSLKRKWQIFFLLCASLSTSFFEVLSFGAVIPFLAALSDPKSLDKILNYLPFDIKIKLASEHLVIIITVIFILLVLFSAIIRLVSLKLNSHFSAEVGSDLSCLAYENILCQPYSYFLKNNSAEIIDKITNQVNLTVVTIYSLFQLITYLFVALALLISFLVLSWKIALIFIVLFSSLYLIVIFSFRRRLKINGVKYVESSAIQLRYLQEGLGSIRDVILDNNYKMFISIYSKADYVKRITQAENAFLTASPKYGFEAVGMITIAFIAGIFTLDPKLNNLIIPTLGAIALGAQRLLPAIQQVFACWGIITSNNAAVSEVNQILSMSYSTKEINSGILNYKNHFMLEDVTFKYSDDSKNILSNLNLKISPGEKIGIIGDTGSGKSTLVDLIMGLLEPISGKITVDDVDINKHGKDNLLNLWRSKISHVPQNIFLIDGSLAENIAFGVKREDISMDKVRFTANIACISDFIETMNGDYSSHIGENGIRLSGGQKQRIGIARALYKATDVLVLDEATSALDSTTEKRVMDSIYTHSPNLTLIIISHRLSTLSLCDKVFSLSGGSLELTNV